MAEGMVEVGKIAASALNQSAEKITSSIIAASPEIGHEAATEIAGAIVKAAPELGAKAAETITQGTVEVAKLGTESIDKLAALGQGVVVILGAVVCIIAAGKVYEIGKDISSYMYPSEEQKNSAIKARESYEAIIAKRNFRNCLNNNKHAARNISGRPVACEELAYLFALSGGTHELEQMTKIFNAFYGK